MTLLTNGVSDFGIGIFLVVVPIFVNPSQLDLKI